MTSKRRASLIIAVIPVVLASCDWVDSTGVQGDSDKPVILLDEGLVVPLVEGERRTLDPGDAFPATDATQLLTWQDTPLQQGRLTACASVQDFAPDFATNTLAEACYTEDACEMAFETVTLDDPDSDSGDSSGIARTGFEVQAPVLKAPVGLTYQLVSTGPDGITAQVNYTFCLVAVNEEPVANDDLYPVVENSTLTVTANGLLANDTDDTDSDVRNLPLSVVLPAVTEPTLAESFELFADGSFTYTPDVTIVLEPGASRTDVFEYQISDGTHSDTASVLINIVAVDAPPQLLEPIPQSQAIVGIRQSISLSEYFSDSEGGELSYFVDTATLPPSGSFKLGALGVLAGTAQPQDVGDWTILVRASDVTGQFVVSDFVLSITDNLPPETFTIPDQSVEVNEMFSLDTSRFFSDPEATDMTYTLTGAASASIAIDRFSGVISGFFSEAADYELTVLVSDGVNQPVSGDFTVTVASKPNQAPAHTGLIENQSVELGQALVPIEGDFSDPDGDVLTYSLLGILPPGVTLSAVSGVVSGTPTKLGVYRNLRIVATDPAGAFARSDTFSITVIAATPNRRPVYRGRIDNQTITLGSAIAVIEGDFSDPDNDPLRYSVVGVLPAGLDLSSDGVLTGRPERIGISNNLRLRATDSFGLSARSDLFRIVVTASPAGTVNRPPEYIGSIQDSNVEMGSELLPIRGQFSDPDGDVLKFRTSGKLPAGIGFDKKAGVLSGVPTVRGVFANIRIVAIDRDGLRAFSDHFSIIVR